MRKLLYLLLVGICCSCDSDFLEEKTNPNALSPGDFWKSEEDILKGLTAAYASLQPSNGWAAATNCFIGWPNLRSDECDKRNDMASWIQLGDFNYESTNGLAGNCWSYRFTGIYRANQVLKGIEQVPDVEKEQKERYIAEARFLRGFYYWDLYLNFGGMLPLWDKPVEKESEYYPDQATPEQILKFIREDFEYAQRHLPPQYASKYAGRITKGAADAMMGRYWLEFGEFAKAAVEFEKVILSKQYRLVDRYGDLFDGDHPNNSESILEVQFSGDRTNGQSEYHDITRHLASFDGGGYQEAYPTQWLYQLMLKDTTVKGEYGDRILATIEFPGGVAFYKGETYTYEEVHGKDSKAVYWKKFVTWSPSQSDRWTRSAFHMPLIRYADVLLMYAEALNEVSGPSQAVFDCINAVRTRARVPRIPQDWKQEKVREHIRHVERPCELALEGKRWYDLIRWNIVGETLKAHRKPGAENFIETKHQVFGIPSEEFRLNPSWKQNPGYGK